MKQKYEFESKTNENTSIMHKNVTQNSSTFSTTKLFALFTLILLVAALSYLYVPVIENESLNILEQENITSSNHISNNHCSVLSDDFKFDCFPKGKADQKSCEARNCCWSPSTLNSQTPWCYYPSNYSNYKVINVTQSRNEIIAFFNLTTNSSYKNDIQVLCMDISFQTAQRLRIKVINISLRYMYLILKLNEIFKNVHLFSV